MKEVAKFLLSASLLAALVTSLAPSAVLARNGQDDLNGLVQEGIISPAQASVIASRSGRYGGWGGGGGFLTINPNFGFLPGQPSHYDTNLINRASAQIRHLQGDRLINAQEKFGLDRQLEARVHMVNDRPNFAQQNYGFNGNPYYNNVNGLNGFHNHRWL